LHRTKFIKKYSTQDGLVYDKTHSISHSNKITHINEDTECPSARKKKLQEQRGSTKLHEHKGSFKINVPNVPLA